jgi:hypothetical protein
VYKALREKAEAHGISMQVAVEQAVRQWVGSGVVEAVAAKRRGRWEEALEEVLASGVKEAVDAVQQNLYVFQRYVRDQSGG